MNASQVYLVSDVNGIWQPTGPVPGLSAISKDPDVSVTSVSCASLGNCTAVGTYGDVSTYVRVGSFAVSEVRGRWQPATVLPRRYGLISVSCASAGNCTAVGEQDSSQAPIVVSEINGSWQQARQIPGLDAIAAKSGDHYPTVNFSASGYYVLLSVSCGSPGNCAVGGSLDGSPGVPFVASQINGTWQQAEVVPGASDARASDEYDNAGLASVSCASAGNCSAAGWDADGHALAANEINGNWQHLTDVRGFAQSPSGYPATESATSVSCTSPGNCTAGGDTFWVAPSAGNQAFVVSEVDGTWQQATQIPGLNALAAGDIETTITSVSCSSPGNCVASGTYGDGHNFVFLASQINGIWHQAVPVPGETQAADNGGPDTSSVSVSCPDTAGTGQPGHPAACAGIMYYGGASQVAVQNTLSTS